LARPAKISFSYVITASPTPRSNVSIESRALRSMISTLRRIAATSAIAASSRSWPPPVSPARPRSAAP
jgi:hypothetical protein